MGCAQSTPSLEPSGAIKGEAPSLRKLATGSSSGFSSLAGNGTAKSTDAKPMRDSALEQPGGSMEGTKGEQALKKKDSKRDAAKGYQEEYACTMETGDSLLEESLRRSTENRHSSATGPNPTGIARNNRGSADTQRSSVNSTASGVRNSTRSSFAADAATLGQASSASAGAVLGPLAGKNKLTAERLAGQPESTGLSGQFVPAALEHHFSLLVVIPQDTPVPTAMLQNLWHTASPAETLSLIGAFQAQGVLRVAQLDDGSTWCLVATPTLQHLQAKYGNKMASVHAAVLDAYSRNSQGSGEGAGSALQVRDIPDDGYIMQNMAHHLLGCSRLGAMRSLLGEPSWLEAKLHSYGTAPVVADFRRYLAEEPEDSGVRLLLQAFQLSLGCCADQPGMHMLREQMVARLISAAHSSQALPALLRSPSGAAAMANRRNDSARSERESHGGNYEDQGPVTESPGAITPLSPPRDSARYSDAIGSLREWFEGQSSHAAMDICTAAGRHCVHLLPRSASLKQAGGLQRMILRGHAGPIHKVVISPNGQDVVTVSADGSAQVWDMNVGDCVMQLARQQALSDVDVAPDGCLCVVASVDGAACVWDLATGNVKHVLRGHTSKINSVAIDRQGKRCVTASDDRSVRLWDIDKGKCQAVLAGHGGHGVGKAGTSSEFGLVFDVALSTDGCMAATASEDFTARIWDLDDAKCEHVLEGHSGWVVSIKFIGETTHVISASHDGTARVWDGIRGCCLHVLEGHTGRLNRVVVDPSGTMAVTCSDDGTARVWDLATGACRHILQRHDAWVADAAIARDGKRCVTVGGDGLVCVWDCITGELQAALEGHSDALRSVVLTGGGRFAVSAGEDGTACVWDLGVKGACAHPQQQGHRAKVLAARALPSRRQVVTSSEDGEVLLWGVSLCKPAGAPKAHTGAAAYLGVSEDGQWILSGTASRQVYCWDATKEDAPPVYTLPAQQGSRVKDMAFSRSGKLVAMVLYDSSTAVHDVTTGKLVAQLIGRGERANRNVHTSGVNGILLCGAHGGEETAVTWSKDCTARVWDVPTNTCRLVMEGHTDGIRCAALSADEAILATASYGPCVRLHLMGDGSPVAVLDHAAPAVLVQFSPDGTLLAVALENHTVVIWDLVGHSCLPPLPAHKGDISGMMFSPDSLLLVTCSQDCTARVWDARNGSPVAFFVADSALTSCCFAGGDPGGLADILVVVDAGGATHFLDLPPELQPGGPGFL